MYDRSALPQENTQEIAKFNVHELLMLRSEIDLLLPAMNLANMNLEEEIVRQYRSAQALQTVTLQSSDEANKKAQVLNSCSAALQACVKMQSDLYTAERFKKIESRLIKALEVIPDEHVKEFLDWYGSGLTE